MHKNNKVLSMIFWVVIPTTYKITQHHNSENQNPNVYYHEKCNKQITNNG